MGKTLQIDTGVTSTCQLSETCKKGDVYKNTNISKVSKRFRLAENKAFKKVIQTEKVEKKMNLSCYSLSRYKLYTLFCKIF